MTTGWLDAVCGNIITYLCIWNTPCNDNMLLTSQSNQLLESWALKLLLYHEHSTKIHTHHLIFSKCQSPFLSPLKYPINCSSYPAKWYHFLFRSNLLIYLSWFKQNQWFKKPINLNEVWTCTFAGRSFYVGRYKTLSLHCRTMGWRICLLIRI